MNKFKVGDRVSWFLEKCEVVDKFRNSVKIKDENGDIWNVPFGSVKPIIKIKNGVVYE